MKCFVQEYYYYYKSGGGGNIFHKWKNILCNIFVCIMFARAEWKLLIHRNYLNYCTIIIIIIANYTFIFFYPYYSYEFCMVFVMANWSF